MADAKGIGQRIKILREHGRLSRKEFGRLFSSRETTVCEWENGHCTPRVAKLIKISMYFGVSLDCILSGRAVGDGALERLLGGESRPGETADAAYVRNVSYLISRYHSMSEVSRERLIGYVDALAASQKAD